MTKAMQLIAKEIFRAAHLPALIALLVMLAGSYYVEQQNNNTYQKQLRDEAEAQVSLVRARIAGNIKANIQLARGLVAVIETEPDMDQARFTELVSSAIYGRNQLRSIAAAPDMVVSMVYPLAENAAVLGLDYRKNIAQREAALRVEKTRSLVVAGPVNLLQGGQGVVARFPVFTAGPTGNDTFWGVVSAVIDVGQLYFESGLYSNPIIKFAIRGTDGTGASGPLFFGAEDVFENDPALAIVSFPSGSWQLAAVPNGGWYTVPENFWTLRILAVLATLVVVVPLFISGWLFDDRAVNLKKLIASEKKFKRVSDRFELALSASKVGVWENQLGENKLYWDKRMRELMGVPKDGPVDVEDFNKSLYPDDATRVRHCIKKAVRNLEPFKVEFRVLLPSGLIRNMRSVGIVTMDAEGHVSIMGINMDITTDVQRADELKEARRQSEQRNVELELAKARIEHNSLHDALTELPNRRYLDNVLGGKGKDAALISGPCGILHLDLDRFKQINDSYGHPAGDAMLVHTANALRETVSDTDFVARIGGDEFVVVCGHDAQPDRLEKLADEIVTRLRQPVPFQGHECRFGVSVGIAIAESAPKNPRQLLSNADIALYQAKKAGRNCHMFFTQELHKAALNTKRLADEIMVGLETGQFLAHYQPQFDAKSRQIIGVEALARWQHPKHGLQAPGYFLEAAEEISVLGDLDALILKQSLAQMKRWRKAGVHIPRVAVNVSARRLHDENLIDKLKDVEFEPGTLAFELVESIYLDDNDDLVAFNLDQIRDLGIELELDDFGTGHTSILSLMRLRPNRLKIDRQLILPTIHDDSQKDLVRSIVQIGASLGIQSVAEGVETEAHAKISSDLGCQTLQGYALARPMTARQISNFYRKQSAA